MAKLHVTDKMSEDTPVSLDWLKKEIVYQQAYQMDTATSKALYAQLSELWDHRDYFVNVEGEWVRFEIYEYTPSFDLISTTA